MNSTEVHILNGSDNFMSYLLQIGTKLEKTNNDTCFYPYKNKLFVIKKQGDNCTELHCIKI